MHSLANTKQEALDQAAWLAVEATEVIKDGGADPRIFCNALLAAVCELRADVAGADATATMLRSLASIYDDVNPQWKTPEQHP